MGFTRKNYSLLKRLLAVISAFALSLNLSACGTAIDPHAGMVSVSDGNGGQMWVQLYDDVPVSSFTSNEFYSDGSYIDYSGTEYTALRGIDVSEHQEEIDWKAVHDDGVQFAIIRVGYRGYSEGKLFEDAYFRKNLDGAVAAGIKVGVYFFSQAVNAAEATEEAKYLLSLINGYDVTLPVFYDWERVTDDGEIRTQDVSGSTVTECCLAFCSTVESAGYEAGVYFYRNLGYYEYELDKLNGLVFWAATTGSYPDFYYRHAMWQYSSTGTVNGINGEADLDILFEETPESSASPSASASPDTLIPPETTMTS